MIVIAPLRLRHQRGSSSAGLAFRFEGMLGWGIQPRLVAQGALRLHRVAVTPPACPPNWFRAGLPLSSASALEPFQTLALAFLHFRGGDADPSTSANG